MGRAAAITFALFVGLAVLLITVQDNARAQSISGSAGVSACSGDLNAGCTQVTATHLTVPLSVEQGGGGTTTGTGWTTRRAATFICAQNVWSLFGLTTLVGNGTATGSAPVNSGPGGVGKRCFIKYTSTGALNEINGLTGSVPNDFRPGVGTRGVFTWFTDASIATRRMWIAESNTTLSGVGGHVPPTASVASALIYAGFGYDPAINGGKWVAASGDGTNESGIDTGVAVSASTFYVLDIDMTKWPTSISFGVNGTYVTKTLNLPIDTVGGFVEQFSTATAAVVINSFIGPYEVFE